MKPTTKELVNRVNNLTVTLDKLNIQIKEYSSITDNRLSNLDAQSNVIDKTTKDSITNINTSINIIKDDINSINNSLVNVYDGGVYPIADVKNSIEKLWANLKKQQHDITDLKIKDHNNYTIVFEAVNKRLDKLEDSKRFDELEDIKKFDEKIDKTLHSLHGLKPASHHIVPIISRKNNIIPNKLEVIPNELEVRFFCPYCYESNIRNINVYCRNTAFELYCDHCNKLIMLDIKL